ncbi:MAG: hypothetical protein N3E41_00010 [Thermofilaceae archaeon]|nr:hypothetical protein [Thermofilaceae archaeon]
MVRTGVAPAVAVLLLVAITVAASLIAYLWIKAYTSSLATDAEPVQLLEILKVEGVSYDGETLRVSLRNVGSAEAEVGSLYILKDGGTTASVSTDLSVRLPPGATATLEAKASLQPGSYTVKLVTKRGVETVTTLNWVKTQPPRPPDEEEPPKPLFRIASYDSEISELWGGSAPFTLSVSNTGGKAGNAIVRIYDHSNALVAEAISFIPAGGTVEKTINVNLPRQRGSYPWIIEAYNEETQEVDDYREFTVRVLSPLFNILSFDATVAGTPNEHVPVTLEVGNTGDAGGSATVGIYDHEGQQVLSLTVNLEAGDIARERVEVTLPGEPGSYEWKITVLNDLTSELDDEKTFRVVVTKLAYFIITGYNPLIEGLPGSTVKLHVTVRNSGGSSGDATVIVQDEEGNNLAKASITGLNPEEEATVLVEVILPSNLGEYKWKIEVYNHYNWLVDDARFLDVIVSAPVFKIMEHDDNVLGPPGGKVKFSVKVVNKGNRGGEAKVEVYNHKGMLIDSKSLYVSPSEPVQEYLDIMLPNEAGTYTWTLRVVNTAMGQQDDEKTFTVRVVSGDDDNPKFTITRYDNTLYGLPNSLAKFFFEVVNLGGKDGVSTIQVLNEKGETVAWKSLNIPGRSSTQGELLVKLPDRVGNYAWAVKVFNNQTRKYDDVKSFTVKVVDITLETRTASIYESFETQPKGWANLGGVWSIVSGGWLGNALRGIDDDGGPGGASIYYLQQQAPVKFQATVKLGSVNRNDQVYRGFSLLENATSRTRLYSIVVYPYGKHIDLRIRYYDSRDKKGWQELSSARVDHTSGWYTLYLDFARYGTQNVFTAALYDSTSKEIVKLSYTDSSSNAFQPRHFSLIVDKGDTVSSIFDELVLASSDPCLITVLGLPGGWTVELWLSGTLVSRASADARGAAALNVVQYPIVRNAKLTVKDQAGNTIVSKDFELLVGGDTLRFSG